MSTNRYFLSFQELSLWVHLGCLPGEQDAPQEVRVTVEVEMLRRPAALDSDHLEDTLSYSDLVVAFQAYCEERPFKTIERLGDAILSRLTPVVGENLIRRLTIHKVNPPVKGLLGGAKFEIRDSLN